MTEKTSKNQQTPDRRGFLKTAAATSAIAAPYFAPASVFGATPPSDRITLACIGTGNQGFPNMKSFLEFDDCQVVAVCDVNRGSHGYNNPKHFYGREPARKAVEDYYGSKQPSGKYKGCDAYSDYREVLARDDVDAVMIVTPDHWHSIQTVEAANAKKDIYCEKPLGLTVADQQAMVKAVRDNNVILQTGSHERSNPNVRKACELVRSGAIGKVRRVITHVGRHNKVGPGPGWEPMPVPDGFDYDLWLGPAPKAPYHEDRCLYRFRFNYDYSGGQITNFGAHSIDMAQWGLGMDDSGPVEFENIYAEFLPEGSLFNAATYTHFRAKYDNGVVLECRTAHPSVRCIFEGTDGVIRVDNQGQNFVTIPRDIKIDAGAKDAPKKYPSNADHHRNFLDCVKSRDEPAAPVEVGHRSATVCHLGNIVLRLGGKLKWDPKEQKVKENSEAASMIGRKQRDAWRA